MKRIFLEILRGQHRELLDQLAVPVEIRRDGACNKSNPRYFDGETISDINAAREICAGCPMAAQCLEWATWNEPVNIWAGTTPRERAKLRNGEEILTIEERQWALQWLADLSSPKTNAQLAARYGVDERNVYRWKQILKKAS